MGGSPGDRQSRQGPTRVDLLGAESDGPLGLSWQEVADLGHPPASRAPYTTLQPLSLVSHGARAPKESLWMGPPEVAPSVLTEACVDERLTFRRELSLEGGAKEALAPGLNV